MSVDMVVATCTAAHADPEMPFLPRYLSESNTNCPKPCAPLCSSFGNCTATELFLTWLLLGNLKQITPLYIYSK